MILPFSASGVYIGADFFDQYSHFRGFLSNRKKLRYGLGLKRLFNRKLSYAVLLESGSDNLLYARRVQKITLLFCFKCSGTLVG
jgi:hypothetical protein